MVLAAAVDEARAQDRTVAGECPGVRRLLEDHFEAVAGLEVAVEVDASAEYVGERERELDLLASCVQRADQRVRAPVNFAAHGDDPGVLFNRNDRRCEGTGALVVGVEDAEEIVGVDLVLELTQDAVERSHELVRTVRAQVARIEDARCRLHRRLDKVHGQLVLAQETAERRIARHTGRNYLDVARQDEVRSGPTGLWLRRTASRSQNSRKSNEDNNLPTHARASSLCQPFPVWQYPAGPRWMRPAGMGKSGDGKWEIQATVRP